MGPICPGIFPVGSDLTEYFILGPILRGPFWLSNSFEQFEKSEVAFVTDHKLSWLSTFENNGLKCSEKC